MCRSAALTDEDITKLENDYKLGAHYIVKCDNMQTSVYYWVNLPNDTIY